MYSYNGCLHFFLDNCSFHKTHFLSGGAVCLNAYGMYGTSENKAVILHCEL